MFVCCVFEPVIEFSRLTYVGDAAPASSGAGATKGSTSLAMCRRTL